MCLEVYSPEQPIQIPFANETIRYLGLRAFRIRYIVLVRNVGYRNIEYLSVLFPRPIYRFTEGTSEGTQVFEVGLAGLEDASHRLLDFASFFDQPVNARLRAHLADPNNPVCDLPGLEGVWAPGNCSMVLPHGLTRRCFLILDAHRFTAWSVRLHQPIAPGDAQWFCWEVTVENEGDLLPDTLHGQLVFHEFSSPLDVRQTLVETLHSALRDIHEHGPEPTPNSEHEVALRRILFHLGLQYERQVDIQYYDLSVQPGNPRSQCIVGHTHQGDIRLRSGSPRVGRHTVWDSEFLGEPIFEWKSGSLLEPAHPWRNLGFSLRLTLSGKAPARRHRRP